MKQKLYIRADGSADIGLGHVVRSTSLAYMLKNDFSIHFFTLKIPDVFKKEIIQNGFQITVFKKEADFLGELNVSDIIVLDGYQFDSKYQKEVKNKGSKLVCIDDFHNQHFYADLVINHAPGITRDVYDGEPFTKYLLGPDYALLRPEFLESKQVDKKRNLRDVKKIFICFGGSDIKNLTAQVLSWLPSKGYSVTIILGSAYSHQKALNRVLKERQDLEINVTQSLSAKEMRNEMSLADLAIVPASGILFEAISLGVPAISGYYVDNQQGIYEGFKSMNVFIDAKQFDREDLLTAIHVTDSKMLHLIRENQIQAIDGLSIDRIRTQFKKLKKV